jgi:hypothetical protein
MGMDWMNRGLRRIVICGIAASFSLAAAPCLSAPEEIQVYTDEMTAPGHFGADIHNSYVFSGPDTPGYPGAQPPDRVYRLTPEFYYGLSENFELGLYLLTTTVSGEPTNYDGEKLRLKYVPDHDRVRGAYWGVNLEVGKTSLRVAQAPWNAELKGIYGYRSGPWLVAVNADLDWSLSKSPDNKVGLGVDTKISYAVAGSTRLGIESYNDLGSIGDPGNLGMQSQTLYGVIDTEIGGVDLNLGIGRGLTAASDQWILKFIVGLHF